MSKPVTLVKNLGQANETRQTVDCSIQDKKGFFAANAPVYEGDVVEVEDPRGGKRQLTVAEVKIQGHGTGLDHLEVVWGKPPQVLQAPIRRLGPENFHPEITKACGDLFADGYYADAILNAFKALEVRVRSLSALDLTGQDLMAKAFNEAAPLIKITREPGQTGDSEQRGFKFLFMGAITGIRNPKAHQFIGQNDPQRTLEYLAFASLLMRRLDDAVVTHGGGSQK